MKAVTVYEAMDGSHFGDPDACLARDRLCAQCDTLLKMLEPIPENDGCSFANGDGYVAQDPKRYVAVLNGALDIFDGYFTSEAARKHSAYARQQGPGHAMDSFVGRYLDDSPNLSPLRSVWSRLRDIDAQCREWGQPFYASNPTAGKQVRLNP